MGMLGLSVGCRQGILEDGAHCQGGEKQLDSWIILRTIWKTLLSTTHGEVEWKMESPGTCGQESRRDDCINSGMDTHLGEPNYEFGRSCNKVTTPIP